MNFPDGKFDTKSTFGRVETKKDGPGISWEASNLKGPKCKIKQKDRSKEFKPY